MQVANCSTPANYFHILRRQLKREIRKPLILMTPKSLLRHKRAVSRLDELATGATFHRVLWDDAQSHPGDHIALKSDDKIRRVVISSGKIYYDLLEARDAGGHDEVYLLRLEQLYPFPARTLIQELARFPNAEIVWAQEEPRNMGARAHMSPRLLHILPQDIDFGYVGRPERASPGEGYPAAHTVEQTRIIRTALDLSVPVSVNPTKQPGER
jgi:2-oxoglutarate dehydrogenase E1 component